jgi:hypothetical protein
VTVLKTIELCIFCELYISEGVTQKKKRREREKKGKGEERGREIFK